MSWIKMVMNFNIANWPIMRLNSLRQQPTLWYAYMHAHNHIQYVMHVYSIGTIYG